MAIRERVVSGLAATQKPVYWQRLDAEGTAPPQYFIFNIMTVENGYSDDEAGERERYVYLEYYSDTAFEESYVETIRTGMKSQGFMSIEERDTSNTYGYQLSMTWYCLEEI